MQNEQLEFSNKFVLNSLVKGKKLIGIFSDSETSSNGGITLINEIDKLLGITRTASKYLTDDRCAVRSKYSFYQFLKSRVMAISCGHEDVNDLDRLRHDSALKESIGIDPACEYGLPSQPTTSKFESSFSDEQVQKFSLCLPEIYTTHSYRKPPKKIILDLDETFMPCYGNQQGSVFTGYEQAYGYKPLFVIDIKLGCVVAIIERPAQTISGKEINTLFGPIFQKIREAWPDVEIVLRGDSHYGKDDFLTWCEETEGVTYITGLPGYKGLGENEEVQKTVTRCIERFERKEAKFKVGKPKPEVRDYCEFSYKAKTWDIERKVIARILIFRTKKGELVTNIRYIVTSIERQHAPKYFYTRIYAKRGQAENIIKEVKLYLKADRQSCKKLVGNKFRLILHGLSHWLFVGISRAIPAHSKHKRLSIPRLQNLLIKIAVQMKSRARTIIAIFTSSSPSEDLFLKILANIQNKSVFLGNVS